MQRAVFVLFVAVLLCGAACGQKEKVLGKYRKEPTSSVLAISAGDAPTTLSLEGTMIEKCPQAGCWFRLDDGSGIIKVDTKAAGFVVTSVPLNQKVKVVGKIQREGEEPILQASGLAY